MARVKPRTLKGFRDYLPSEDGRRQAALSTVARVFESHGFGPLTTPALEYAEVLLGKYGDEGDQLLYRFDDNGGRDVALRYDLTVPLARVVAQHGSLPQPFRRYQIAPVWRAEKPARGRFREFLQCDVDIVGEPSERADAECMMVGLDVLEALGVPDFVMRVNDRRILDGMMDRIDVPEGPRRFELLRAIDKLPKIGRDGVVSELEQVCGLDGERIEGLFEVLETPVDGAESLMALTALFDGTSDAGLAGVDGLARVLGCLEEAGYARRVAVDLSIARGLAYYTATIYETFVAELEAFGSVMSGGRYDELLGMFLKRSLPAVGISLGVDRLLAVLEAMQLGPQQQAAADVYLALFDEAGYGACARLAQRLRSAEVKVEMALAPAKLAKQLKQATRRGYRWVLFADPDERNRGEVIVKDLDRGQQHAIADSEATQWLSARLREG